MKRTKGDLLKEMHATLKQWQNIQCEGDLCGFWLETSKFLVFSISFFISISFVSFQFLTSFGSLVLLVEKKAQIEFVCCSVFGAKIKVYVSVSKRFQYESFESEKYSSGWLQHFHRIAQNPCAPFNVNPQWKVAPHSYSNMTGFIVKKNEKL